MADKTTSFYTTVQHDGYVAVHAATADEDGTLLHIQPNEQALTDLTKDHLTNFLSLVMVGLTRPTVDAATFTRLSTVQVQATA